VPAEVLSSLSMFLPSFEVEQTLMNLRPELIQRVCRRTAIRKSGERYARIPK